MDLFTCLSFLCIPLNYFMICFNTTASFEDQSLDFIEDQSHDSIEEVISEVYDHLRHDDGTEIIAIQAADGMGKSTVLRRIREKFVEASFRRGLFDVILYATVSRRDSIQRLQKDLLASLGLSPVARQESNLQETYAQMLLDALSNRRFLLLLDDVEENLDLSSVGIPTCRSDNSRKKIVITTKSSAVCDHIGAHHTLQIRPLDDHKSRKLFWENVKAITDGDDPGMKVLEERMIRNFRGLRLAPILMGRAMLSRLDHAVLEEAVKAWEHKHRGWEQASQGLEQVLYATLEFVYGSLATDRMRECLLYCCLFPEGRDISREQLIDYWFEEGLLDITEKAGLYIARSKGYKLLHTLLSAGLLEKGDHDEERSVKVPDSVRMMAQSLGFLTTRGNNKFVAPLKVTGDDTVPQARWASLTQNEPADLCEQRYPRMSTIFILCKQPGDTDIKASSMSSFLPSDSFLQFFPCLRVLDLSRTCLEAVPSSISILRELRYLNLSSTEIKSLPTELGELKNLRVLLLTNTNNLSTIPHKVISSLQELHLLNMYMSAHFFTSAVLTTAAESGRDGQERIAGIETLEAFDRLNELGLNLNSRTSLLRLCANIRLHLCTRFLNVSRVDDLVGLDLSKAFRVLSCLKELSLSSCSKLNELTVEQDQLPQLQVLNLEDLPLSAVSAESGALVSLRWLRVTRCNSMENLSWAGRLPSLEGLDVVSCSGMELLTGDADQNSFPKLRIMELRHLQLLRCISGNQSPHFLSLERLHIEGCRQLTVFPFRPDTAKKLTHIHGEQAWWERLEWPESDGAHSRQTLEAFFWPVADSSTPVVGRSNGSSPDTSVTAITGSDESVTEQQDDASKAPCPSSDLPRSSSSTTANTQNSLSPDKAVVVSSHAKVHLPDHSSHKLAHAILSLAKASNRVKCFWLDEETGKGCCMLSATDLWIALGNDRRYWRTTWHEDARSAQVAEMINVCWLDIQGNLMIQDLSIATLYTVSLIYKLNSENKGLEGPIRSSVTHGRRSSQRRVCMQRQSNWSNEEPRGRPDGWMELKLGEFTVQSGENETVYFGVKETERLNWKGGLVIEGIEVRPLWRVPSDDSSSAEPLDESEAERLLPSDYEEIFSRCVDRPKFSTKLDLYLQLCNSILIDEGRKSFMLERSTGKKCYVLSARDLSIIWGNDQRYWKWKSAAENSRFSEVAELLMVCWLDIKGSINTEDLSPHTDYSVYLIFKWNGMQYGFNDWLKASVSVGSYSSEPRRVSLKPVEYDSLPFERGDGWLEVEMGVFVVGDVISAEESVQFELKEVERLDWKRGLIIQGVEVKPKRMESSERLRRPTIQLLSGDYDKKSGEFRRRTSIRGFGKHADSSDIIRIDKGRKAVSWLDKATSKRCYLLSSAELTIAWGNDQDCWRRTEHEGSRFSEVAQLLRVCQIHVQGRMKVRDLSPGTLYTASLIYKLSVVNYGFEGPFRSSVSVGRRTSEREVFMDLDEQPRGRRDGWMELKLGEFSVRTGENGTVQFGLKETERLNWKGGLVIEGIEIRPVWMSSTDHDSGAEPLDESEAERLLPSDYEEILSRCVNPPNVSSKLDLYLQLCNSILTDEGRKRFMLERSTGKKCYVLSARDLDITWGNDQRYWRWESAPENSRFSEVAKLLQVCWLNIAGRINICELTPDTEYGVYLIYSIQNGSFGLYGSQEASVAVGQIISQQRKVHLMRDYDGWLEVELGDFRVDDVSDENEIVQFELKEASRFNSSPGLKEDKMLNWKSGLIIEGIEVKPTMEAKH